MEVVKDAGKVGKEKHPRKVDTWLNYGTAGFRARAELLDHVLYRIGLLAALRSKSKGGVTIGVMITASHNPECDNGVKLVDPAGEMLEASWEKHAAHLANVNDADVSECLKSLIAALAIDLTIQPNIVFARDTRPSSEVLAQSLRDGLDVMQTHYTDYGVLTTPQLHYMVRCHNTKGQYGEATEDGYYKKLSTAFINLRGQKSVSGHYQPHICIDGANGVGALKMAQMMTYLKETITVDVYNDGKQGKLNDQCGADYVKIQQMAPQGLTLGLGMRCASFDGDADRIVFYYLDQGEKFCLLDGDKIATLIAGYLKELVTQSGLDLDLGLVQTAYANGSSTRFINNKLHVPVACVPTGVKHLHQRALQFDIGVYFEANGHGTVLFSEKAEKKVKELIIGTGVPEDQRLAALRLSAVIDLINQTVGDAVSDLLLVETVLLDKGWSIADWNAAYTDLPNRQLKVKVKDRTVIQTTDAERRATAPAGLQTEIDNLVALYNEARAFVRPSGTEDIVRIYAEADTRTNADKLAYEVSVQVYQLAGGIGKMPTPPTS
ncbi:hypothetical protein LSH36_68g16012 [Paralvinella palmiformis]|uniref:Phosphoacetylglucosamine mutase n=1 Tax=Paralvinella palmiformis TaxID=53620 RepID=A0AAD9K4F2_9ANNE|nr:hypothetical protein LSH36_68g16012 [Paralvinella palmiformis]